MVINKKVITGGKAIKMRGSFLRFKPLHNFSFSPNTCSICDIVQLLSGLNERSSKALLKLRNNKSSKTQVVVLVHGIQPAKVMTTICKQLHGKGEKGGLSLKIAICSQNNGN